MQLVVDQSDVIESSGLQLVTNSCLLFLTRKVIDSTIDSTGLHDVQWSIGNGTELPEKSFNVMRNDISSAHSH